MTPPRRTKPALYDAALEAATLGAMLSSESVCRKGLEALTTADFGDPRAREVFEAIRAIGAPADPVRVRHRAGAESGPYIASAVHECARPTVKLVEDMLALRARRGLADAAELVKQASEDTDPATALQLARMLIAEEPHRNGHREWTAADLLAADFPEPAWIVPTMLTEGLAVVAGRPKARKSFLLLQLAIAKATGGMFLGQQLSREPVIYFGLEDGERRLAKRLRDLCCPQNAGELHCRFTMPPLGHGAVEHLTELVERIGPSVVVVDTISKAMPLGSDQDKNADMTALLGPLQRLALDHHLALMVIDHLGKRSEGPVAERNVLTEVMGSTAKVAVADTIWGLYRKPKEAKGTLSVIGRDVEDVDWLLEFRPTPAAWQLIGNAEDAKRSESEQRYVDAVRELGPAAVESRAIADYLGVSPQAATEMLRKLREKRELELIVKPRSSGGRTFLYTVPAEPRARARENAPLVFPVRAPVWDGPWWEEH